MPLEYMEGTAGDIRETIYLTFLDMRIRELYAFLGKPVFEIPAMPPSIPGMRLKKTFLTSFAGQ